MPPGCIRLRPALATQAVGTRWPAMLALGSTWVDALVEALLRCKEADALGAESGEGHDIDEVERRPRHVIAHHLEVHQLEHRLLLRALHRALELLLDLGDARGDVARLVARVRAHALDHVRRGLLEHRPARHWLSPRRGVDVCLPAPLCPLQNKPRNDLVDVPSSDHSYTVTGAGAALGPQFTK